MMSVLLLTCASTQRQTYEHTKQAIYLNCPVSDLVCICQVHLCAAVANLASATQHNPLPEQEHPQILQHSQCSFQLLLKHRGGHIQIGSMLVRADTAWCLNAVRTTSGLGLTHPPPLGQAAKQTCPAVGARWTGADLCKSQCNSAKRKSS